MSTVVLTPTHMASDHTVVHRGYPIQTEIDLSYKKIFIPPHRYFMIGTVGDFIPDMIDQPRVWDMVGFVFASALSDNACFGMPGGNVQIDNEDLALQWIAAFDEGGRTFIVSKKYRFVVKYDVIFKNLVVKRVGDYAGIGSGGMIAAGLAMGARKLADIFPPLHQLDQMSSVEHTIVPLSVLKNNPSLDKKLVKARQDVMDGKTKKT